MPPEDLASVLLFIEEKLGRKRNKKNDPRTCDIDIIDINGKIIHTLINNVIIFAGYHEYSLQSQQSELANGIYLYKIETIDWMETKKMLFIK